MPKRQAVFLVLARLWVGGLFAFSGWVKVIAPYENFRGILVQYGLIPSAAAPLIAQIFPWLELILGIFLLAGWSLPFSSLGAAVLSGSFFLLIAISKIFGIALPAECGCFGEGLHFTPAQMLGVDAVSAALALLLYFKKESFLTLDSFLTPKGS